MPMGTRECKRQKWLPFDRRRCHSLPPRVCRRDAFKVRRHEEVARLKKELAGKVKNLPRIITFSGNGGGGHEATLVRTLALLSAL